MASTVMSRGNPLADMLLRRLRRLKSLLPEDPQCSGVGKGVSKAIFSTLIDLRELGLGAEADRIIHEDVWF